MKQRLRAALWQGAPGSGNVAANLDVIESRARSAREQGADILICPEMMLTGYNIGSQQIERLAEHSEGASAERVARIATRFELAIAYGYPERDGGDVYNAALLIDANGRTLLNYRKAHLFGAQEKACFQTGEILDAVATFNGWTVGLLICYDVEFPEATRLLALAGADLVLVPTALMKPYESLPGVLIPARAYENQIYLAYANYCGSEGDLDYCGNSIIASPTGTCLARADKDEALLLADISAIELAASRKLNTYFDDRRPQLYSDLSRVGDGS